jgi:hypothetical protein
LIDNVNCLAGPNILCSFFDLRKEMQIGINFVVPDMDYDQAEVKIFEILLMLQRTIRSSRKRQTVAGLTSTERRLRCCANLFG